MANWYQLEQNNEEKKQLMKSSMKRINVNLNRYLKNNESESFNKSYFF